MRYLVRTHSAHMGWITRYNGPYVFEAIEKYRYYGEIGYTTRAILKSESGIQTIVKSSIPTIELPPELTFKPFSFNA